MILAAWNQAQGVPIHNWFWIGAALLAVGMMFFLLMGLADGPGHENHFTTSFFINLIAATTYLAMAMGLGSAVNADGNVFYYARYIDWLLTTPLLLLNLAMVATFNVGRKTALVAAIMGLDVFMIVTGLIAAMTSGSVKWVFYFLSCLAFLGVIALIWSVLRREAAKLTFEELHVYNTVTGLLTALWLLYPLVWLVGTEGLGTVSASIEAMLYMFLDVAAKLGFGLVLLSSVRKMVPKQATADEIEDILVPVAATA